MAEAESPTLSCRSSTASFVIEAVMTTPLAISIFSCSESVAL